MLFVAASLYRTISTEDSEREGFERFAKWSPAAGAELKALYVRADGRGFFAHLESSSAAAVLESLLPFTKNLDFEVLPVIDADEGVPIVRRLRGMD